MRSHQTKDGTHWTLVPWLRDTDINTNHDWRLLFVGNSYTEYNNLAGMIKHIFQDQWNARVLVKAHHPGGETFLGHYASTRKDYHPPSTTDEGYVPSSPGLYTELRTWLVTKPRPWDWVILQEQSQVPGFWQVPEIPPDSSYNTSLHASQKLNRLVERLPSINTSNNTATGTAQTMFYLTWGRRNGDDYNKALYPDYPTMQARISQGYQQYQKATSREGRPTYIAPVGLVFETIYHQDKKKRSRSKSSYNPGTDKYSLFYQLYDVDDSHPSLAGSYLAALTIYASILGDDPRDVHWTPPGVTPSMASNIRQAVARTILETVSNGLIDYPWQTTTTQSNNNDVYQQQGSKEKAAMEHIP